MPAGNTVFDQLLALDASLFLRINALPHPNWLMTVMTAMSLVTRGAVLWLILSIGLLLSHRTDWSGVWRILLALMVTSIVVSSLMKPAFDRTRPNVTEAIIPVVGTTPTTPSFPSGHAATSAAGAYALSRIWPGAALPLWSATLLVASSRVYLGVHYPLDVIVGLFVGLACAYFVTGGMVYRSVSATSALVRGPSRKSGNP